MSQCKIHLENYNGTYYPGTEIRGRLECYFDDETNLRGIKIRLKCKEHNEWTGTEEYNDPLSHERKTRYITVTGERVAFYVEHVLYGSDHGSHTLNRGRHVYPFTFFLPHDIPSSFSGPHGSIIFKLKAVVDRPMKFDYEDEFIINVMSPIDFNHMPQQLQNPASYSDEKTVCCWCCQGGSIAMDVELPKTGVIVGEIIPLKVHISNLSNSNVEEIVVKLSKTITYKVTDPHQETKDDVEEIVSLRDHGVGAHGEHTFNMQLQIPPHIVIPNFTRCDLFKVSYKMEVSCVIAGCTMNLDVVIWDLVLGHVQWNGGQTREQAPAAFGFNSHSNLPPIDGVYPPGGGFVAPPGGYQPPPAVAPFAPPPGGAYPTSPVGGAYPPSPAAGGYPPSPTAGVYPPPIVAPYPPSNVGFGQGGPSAPPPSYGQPYGGSKAQEAAGGAPTAPVETPPEMPPPSYNQVQQGSNNYYPPR